MELQAIRRHPVKAMAGESLTEVEVGPRGLENDRWYAATTADGGLVTGKNSRRFRRHDEIFEFGARTVGSDADVEVYRHDGTAGPWSAGITELNEYLTELIGEPIRVVTEDMGVHEHYDDAPISLVGTASLDWFAEHHGFIVDDRRIRANLVVATEVPFEEEAWTGVTVGDLELTTLKRITRCRMVDLAQNHLTDTLPLLKTLGAEREVKLGVYFTPPPDGVTTVRVGDPVTPRT